MGNIAGQYNTSISELHFENLLHLNKLTFYKQEIKIFINRLEQIVSINDTTAEAYKGEQLQRQFARYLQIINELESTVNSLENDLEMRKRENITAIDYPLHENTGITASMLRFAELYNAMKGDFLKFLSEHK